MLSLIPLVHSVCENGLVALSSIPLVHSVPGGGGLPYMGYMGSCCWTGYAFGTFKSGTGYNKTPFTGLEQGIIFPEISTRLA